MRGKKNETPTMARLQETGPESAKNWEEVFARAKDEDLVQLAVDGPLAKLHHTAHMRAIVERDRRQRRGYEKTALHTLWNAWFTAVGAIACVVCAVEVVRCWLLR